MRFIHAWSYAGARFLAEQLKENHEKRRVYYYGFQVLVGAAVKGVLLISISIAFRVLLPALVITLIFGSLRMLAGGYHMNTYGKCISVSIALIIVSAVVARYTYQYWDQVYLIAFTGLSFALGAYIILRWAPSDNPNRPINEPEEKNRFKLFSLLYLLGLIALISILIYLKFQNYQMYVISGCFGLLLELFTVTPLGHSFFERLSGRVDRLS